MGSPISALLDASRFEILPLKSSAGAVAALPPASEVSVTCSPAHGLHVMQDLVARLADLGHHAVPHIAARLVQDRDHARRLAGWCRDHGIREVFVIAGDALEPSGPYPGAEPFLRDFLDAGPGVSGVGISGYPDGHPLIAKHTLSDALLAKQELLESAGVQSMISTQMCFDVERIVSWVQHIRADGVTLPIRLGVPGVVDKGKLLALGTRVGVGASLRYLRKNRALVGKLAMPGGYDPLTLIRAIIPNAEACAIEALHVFTFNAVQPTLERWAAAH